ncbi:hypothetical protein HMPREF3034_01258 [Prevotella sp. DNF00663]|uniref:hypothetical protein n=1 Tax=unclassified Prevotella TaxID=2638335 RepID=UPI000513250B|nr:MULTISPECIES: hypothetical protein [unclassified Prevotella]KGI61170.1 hypothetical protein HMPREF0671_01825 [Prevotella sp. S7 MS 2]KXB83363.1 hypothetical protein HMPREF3034_01258 [Prevotella sp. DNF00663]
MGKDIKIIWKEVQAKLNARETIQVDFEKLSKYFSKHHIHLKSASLRKLWKYVKGIEKPSPEVLDRLALLAGFDDWNTLRTTFKDEEENTNNK